MPGSRWLFLTVPGFFLSAVLLALIIRSLLRTLSGAAVASVPVGKAQVFTVPEAGPYAVYIQGRLGTTDFAGLDYRVTDASGAGVPLDRVVFRSTTTSMSGRVTLQVRSFVAPAPGTYILDVSGLRSGAAPDNRVIISRPVRGGMIAHILGLVAFGSLTIGSLVATVLLVVRPGRAVPP